MTPGSLTRAVSVARRAIGDTHKGDADPERRAARLPLRAARSCALAAASRRRRARGRGAAAARRFVGRDRRARAAARGVRRGGRRVAARVALVSGPARHRQDAARRGRSPPSVRGAARRARAGRARRATARACRAFWLFVQVLRQLAGGGRRWRGSCASSAARRGRARRPPARARGATAGARRAPSDAAPEQSRFLLFDAVARALARASRQPAARRSCSRTAVGRAGLAAAARAPGLRGRAASRILVLAYACATSLRERGRPARSHARACCASSRAAPSSRSAASRGATSPRCSSAAIGRPAPLGPDLRALRAHRGRAALPARGDPPPRRARRRCEQPERIRRWAVTLPAHVLDLIRRAARAALAARAELLAAARCSGASSPLAARGRGRRTSSATRALDLVDEAERAGVLEAAPDERGDAGASRTRSSRRRSTPGCRAAGARACTRARRDALERQHAGRPGRGDRRARAPSPPGARRRATRSARSSARVAAAERARRLYAYEQAAMHWEQASAALEHRAAVEPRAPLRDGARARRGAPASRAIRSAPARGVRPRARARARARPAARPRARRDRLRRPLAVGRRTTTARAAALVEAGGSLGEAKGAARAAPRAPRLLRRARRRRASRSRARARRSRSRAESGDTEALAECALRAPLRARRARRRRGARVARARAASRRARAEAAATRA